jgi:LacI family transcriptional regulator
MRRSQSEEPVVRPAPARRSIATLPDVARAAGVSTATAARALGGYGSVSPATKDKVLATAEELGYRANSVARSMITGTTNTIGVVVADIENPFFSRALRGIADTARAAGFEVILTNTDEDGGKEQAAVRVLTEKRVDGLVVCPASGGGADHLATAIAGHTPVVLLDRRVPGLPADTVGISNRAAGREVTQRLIDLGHRRVGLLTGGDMTTDAALLRPGLHGVERLTATTGGERAAGYRDALVGAGLVADPRYVSVEGFHRDDAAAATRRLLDLPDPPTALIALDSVLALGALQALQDADVRCPQEVSLIGFDDADWAEVVTPPLSVIAQPVYEIGVRACELLLRRIEGDTRRTVHLKLPTRFIDRESAGPAPRRNS